MKYKKGANPLKLMGYFCVLKKNISKLNIFFLTLLFIIFSNMSINKPLFASDIYLVEGFANAFALTAKKGSLESVIKNPATGKTTSHKQVLININESYGLGVYHGLLGTGYELKSDLLLVALLPFTSIAAIDETIINNGSPQKIGQYSTWKLSPQVTLSKKILDAMVIGGSMIGLYETINSEYAKGISFDTGLVFNLKKINLGVSIQNIGFQNYWSTQKKEKKNLKVNAGIALKPMKQLEILSDVSIIKATVITNSAINYLVSSYLNVQVGLRDVGKSNQLRAGASLNLDSFEVHYSYGSHVELGDSHKLGMTVGL